MKVHSVIDIITNSSTEIFVSVHSTKPIEELLNKLGVVAKVVVEDDPQWIRDVLVSYRWNKKNGRTELTEEEYIQKSKAYEDHVDTVYLVLENGERVDLKAIFEDAFEIEAKYNG